MDLEGIIAIAGKPGLFRILSRSQKGLVVESILDGKKMPALATHKISALEDISMYTYDEDVPLKEILPRVKENFGGKPAEVNKLSKTELEDNFEKVLPDFDRDRVYPSDIKKLFSWYNLLLKHGMLAAKAEAPAKEEIEEAEIVEESSEPKAADKKKED